MLRAGSVVRTAGGLAILRVPDGASDPGTGVQGGQPAGDVPQIGAEVVDESMATVGRVVDVFGPVERPYLAVATESGTDPATLLGTRLYARD